MISTVFSAFSGWAKNSGRLVGMVAVCTLAVACGRSKVTPPEPAGPPPAEIWKEFSGENALATAREIAALGPRPSGSKEAEATRALLAERMEKNGWSITRQSVTQLTPQGPIKFVNLVARYGHTKPEQRFLVGAHYDTRLMESIVHVGANDGASGPAGLIELARVLSLDPALAQQVEIVFFDGKEAQVQPSDVDGLYGSRHYLKETANAKERFRAVIIWNLIGAADLAITFPYDSTRSLGDDFEVAAEALDARSLFSYSARPIWDDHLSFVKLDIPVLGVIDGRYPQRHTADDTAEALSAASLQTVGAVTLRWLKTAAAQP